jgi:hypothetical protein
VIYNDFGIYHYNGMNFYLKEMHIIGPSRLLWQGLRFALEIQVVGIADDDESILTLVSLFEENKSLENGFFYELGFGNYQLILLDQFSENEDSFYQIANSFTLDSLYDPSGTDLLLFQGKSNIYCTESIVLVNLNFQFIGSKQLTDFEFYLNPQVPEEPLSPPKRPPILYSNILSSHKQYFYKSSHYHYDMRIQFGVSRALHENPIVPSDVVLQRMMFTLNAGGELPLGYFDETDDERIAVWDPRIEDLPKIDLEPVFRRSSHFKYIGIAHFFYFKFC